MQLILPFIFGAITVIIGLIGAFGIAYVLVELATRTLPGFINWIHKELKLPLYGDPIPPLRDSKARPAFNPLPPRIDQPYSKEFSHTIPTVPFTSDAIKPAPDRNMVGGTTVFASEKLCRGCGQYRKIFRDSVCLKCSAEHETTT